MPKVYRRAAAKRDLIEHFIYLAENVNLDMAEHFLAQAEASFNELAQHPLIGAPLKLRAAELSGLRKWRVRGFDNCMIFYTPKSDGVSVVRVLHAARDWWSVLGIDA